ncbi:MAG: endonuclease/exonuclease/phosphatase family protein [Pirellulales bacterium]
MLRQPTGFLFAAIAVALLYFAFSGAARKRQAGLAGGPQGPATHTSATSRPPARDSETIRIASFNLRQFDERRLQSPGAVELLAKILRQFDVIAVQEITGRSQELLPALCDRINSQGAYYDYVVGPRLGRGNTKEQYAFLYDRASVEVDRNQLYTVEDRDDLLHREPLVGWFRVRGPNANEAFTFSLVNVRVDERETVQELNVLDDVFFAVRSDGLEEDDVILLGDLNADDRKLGELGRVPNLLAVVAKLATTTRGDAQVDNILFDQQATSEFTGRGGTLDFLREYNLSLEQAQVISDHLPVWAEFSVFEGGTAGRFATRPRRDSRR